MKEYAKSNAVNTGESSPFLLWRLFEKVRACPKPDSLSYWACLFGRYKNGKKDDEHLLAQRVRSFSSRPRIHAHFEM